MRRLLFALLAVLAVVAVPAGWGYRNARADPVVRRAAFALPRWPAGVRPVTVALLSDIHAGNRATDPARLARVVAQTVALRPDLILIAGDFLPGDAPIGAAEAARRLAPLRGLRAPLGVVAVPGNHDHWTGLPAVREALGRAGITLLANDALQRGPLAIGALDDAFSGHADVGRTVAALRRLPGARLVLTHAPDVAARVPAEVPLVLAGHTHCGQVVLSGLGSLADGRFYQPRYRCGIAGSRGQAVVVTGGIGGSLPFRLGAPPDLWLLTLGPTGRAR